MGSRRSQCKAGCMTMPAQPQTAPDMSEARKIRTRQLAEWGKLARQHTHMASALGLLQAVLFCGFAWGVASAVHALVQGEPFLPGLVLAIASAGARALCQAGETRFGFEASARVRAQLRLDAARALADQGPQATTRSETGTLTASLVDGVDKLDGFYGRYRPLLPVVMGAPVILLIAAVTQSWVVATIFLVTAPLLIVFMALVGAAAAAASRDQLDTLTRLAGRFSDRLQTLETLNAFSGVEQERRGLYESAELFRQRTMRVLAMAFLSSTVLEFFSAIAVAGTAVYVGFSLLGELPFDPGETLDLRAGLFLLILAPEFYMPLRRLSAAYHDRADADAACDLLLPIVSDETRIAPRSDITLETPPEIRFETVTSIYDDGRTGVNALSFTAQPGEITALWGPSGIGKSTALKLILGYAPITSGAVQVSGEPMDGPLLGQAAWIAQRPRIFHGTLRDNITLFDPSITDERVQRAAEQAGVTDFADSLPDGLDTALGERGAGVSGGQAQRIALARALAVDMKLLLLDEPTAHLDGEAEARFIAALKRIAKDRTVLVATHSPAMHAIADRVVDLARPQ